MLLGIGIRHKALINGLKNYDDRQYEKAQELFLKLSRWLNEPRIKLQLLNLNRERHFNEVNRSFNHSFAIVVSYGVPSHSQRYKTAEERKVMNSQLQVIQKQC